MSELGPAVQELYGWVWVCYELREGRFLFLLWWRGRGDGQVCLDNTTALRL
jgi:hypothetical protein